MIEKEFLEAAIKRFKEYRSLGEKTFAQLNDADMQFRPNEESNNIGVIIQHMYGNMLSRWTNFLTEDGEKPWRQRDDEFEVHEFSKQQLTEKWNQGWDLFLKTLESLREDDLSKTVTIRGEALSVVDAIVRQQMHYASHVGQIVYLGKMIKGSSWTSLSIPKKRSQAFNEEVNKSGH